jgi:hypothetical protein
VIAENLATQPDACQAAGLQHVAFGDRHLARLAGDELDAAGRAAGIAAAGVELINSRILDQGQYEALGGWNFESTDAFDRELGHAYRPLNL